ncbi:MAG: glycosyltransferase family 4 protein [Bacteroidales bacterium]|jgi:glycosyltransferase involved in cell wall biosynthesis|nr:glycosyltransferase family 4 protein [Bacteroidales bacterium]
MKRVLRIVNRFNLGGPTFNAAYLTKYLSPEYETMLIGGIHEDDEESSEFILNNLGINAIILPEMRRSINGIGDYQAYRKIKKIIKEFKPDIVHTHASKAGMLGRKAAVDLNVPVIVHTFHGHVFHSYFNPIKTRTFIQIERFLASKTDAIIAISQAQKNELSNVFCIAPEEKINVIPLGLDLSRFITNQDEKRYVFRKENYLDDDEIAIAIVGRMVPIKNHQLFVKAIAEAKQQTQKKIRAFIVGDGQSRDEIEVLAHKLNLVISPNGTTTLKPDIRFSSWIKNVDYVYAGVDIVALTSLNEGTPVSLIEAQAAGKPIVSTNVGGIKDISIEGKSILLSESNDEKAFIENLIKLINDDELRLKMKNNAKDFIIKRFDYHRLVSDVSELYSNLLSTKNMNRNIKVFA